MRNDDVETVCGGIDDSDLSVLIEIDAKVFFEQLPRFPDCARAVLDVLVPRRADAENGNRITRAERADGDVLQFRVVRDRDELCRSGGVGGVKVEVGLDRSLSIGEESSLELWIFPRASDNSRSDRLRSHWLAQYFDGLGGSVQSRQVEMTVLTQHLDESADQPFARRLWFLGFHGEALRLVSGVVLVVIVMFVS